MHVVLTQAVACTIVDAETGQVERRAQVHEERVVGRPAEHLLAAGSGGVRHLAQPIRGVVGLVQSHAAIDGTGPHVVGRHLAVGHNVALAHASHEFLAGVGRLQVLRPRYGVRVADIEEGRRLLVGVRKGEAVHDVVARRARVVFHVQLVAHIFAKRGIVRAALGQLKRNVVGDKDNAIRIIRVLKCVHVRIIGDGVVGNHRGFAVATGLQRNVVRGAPDRKRRDGPHAQHPVQRLT